MRTYKEIIEYLKDNYRLSKRECNLIKKTYNLVCNIEPKVNKLGTLVRVSKTARDWYLTSSAQYAYGIGNDSCDDDYFGYLLAIDVAVNNLPGIIKDENVDNVRILFENGFDSWFDKIDLRKK